MADKALDSKEGIAEIMAWAKSGGFVLDEYHERIAIRHGVSTEGVTIRRPLPTYQLPIFYPR